MHCVFVLYRLVFSHSFLLAIYLAIYYASCVSFTLFTKILRALPTHIDTMDPPVEGSYATRNDLIHDVQNHAKTHGYSITIKRSCNRNGIVVLGCDRGGNYRARNRIDDATRIRDTSTRLQGCPFELRGKSKDNKWKLTVKEAFHNHEASSVPSAHPVQRRMPDEIKTQVQELMAAGIPAQQIATVIRQGSDHPLVAQDIYNVQKLVRLESLGGKTPMEALVSKMKTGLYTFNYKSNAEGRVTHISFAHSRSVKMLNQ